MTRKLYYEDLYAREFDAEILSCSEHDGRFHVVLNQTLFYPSGGGQPCDLGTIDGIDVLEVFEKGGEIVHVLASAPKIEHVLGVIDWSRRFELMQQHLGEHLFAGSLWNLSQIHTARMRIEGENVSIDTDTPADMSAILEAERAANEAVWADIPVEVIYPSIDEVKANARKLPPEDAELPIRIVKVEGVDYVPCCGVHVSSTGQVGLVKVTSVENHKGGSRIYLRCGRAAYMWVDSVHREVRKAEAELVCGYDGINDKIASLKNQIHSLKAENEATLERFLRPLAEDLVKGAENFGERRIVKYIAPSAGQEEVKHLFRLLTERREVVALLAGGNSEGAFLMFGTHKENKGVDVRPAFRRAMELLGGKGGGSPFCAQGWSTNAEGAEDALNTAISELKNSMK
ncbi:MAG: hypothetical protein II954_03130 [Synergistaceae bacterium]|nr:hypothetical protein [Synergistaceae bacterium]